MSEANAPFDSTNQPESNQPEANSPESRVESVSSGRPKAFSELKALTDLAEVVSPNESMTQPQLERPSNPEARSIWHNVRQNARPADAASQPRGQSPHATPTDDPSLFLSQNDEIEFDISKIFDASALDHLAFESEPTAQPDLSPTELAEIDLWADPDPLVSEIDAALEAVNAAPHPTGSIDLMAADLLVDPSAAGSLEASPTEAASPEVPSLASLIGLIQELNQCNGVLMDRVSQLEEALETSQSALQAEVGRIHDTEVGQDWNNSQDWATVQDQVANLFNQLEFAHQTNQRQQILMETLTSQLENSQERVAQLEREAALIQQRYDEQAQLLVKAEHRNRDLQARLQRQQRYTLQFKVALERSLEVAAPSYETSLYEMSSVESRPSPLEAAENMQFLPKAKQIQPWSAQSQLPLSQATWMKLQSSLSPLTDERAASPDAENSSRLEDLDTVWSASAGALEMISPAGSDSTGSAPAGFAAEISAAEATAKAVAKAAQPQDPAAEPATTHLNLPAFGLPLLQFADSDPGSNASDASASESQPLPTLSDPMLNQLDEVVKPLADMLAEAMLAGSTSQQPASQAPDLHSTPNANADELLASVMADPEDALWQDLARLIDVSTEDVVKASLSGDLAAFESIDFAALNSSSAQAAPQAAPPSRPANATPAAAAPELPASELPTPELTDADAAAIASWLHRPNQNPNQSPNQTNPASPADPAPVPAIPAAELDLEAEQPSDQAALAPASWPSPVVYPLRPVKKRQSLAMVDLPTFPRN